MEFFKIRYIILGNDYIINYGIDVIKINGRYLAINADLLTRFQMGISDTPNLYQLECNAIKHSRFESTIEEAKNNEHLLEEEKAKILQVLHNHHLSFANADKTFGKIKGNEVKINLNTSRPTLLPLRKHLSQHVPGGEMIWKSTYQH